MGQVTGRIFKMQNPIQTYAWGSHSAIAELLGQEVPSPEPQAEIWMGAHPKSPSRVRIDGQWRSLLELIDHYPQDFLGQEVSDRFDCTLPYLFKVLAADEPLSIQAHPDATQASDGFERENRQGLPLDDPRRNYRDDRPKPECMCALTPFTGLCGFRTPYAAMTLCASVWPTDASAQLEILGNSNQHDGLHDFFQSLMRLDADRMAELTAQVAEKAGKIHGQSGIYSWIVKLYRDYPGDVGVLSPLMLNMIQLRPGEAIFLPPKQLHAYLDGMGIELMANSDNVLRGGLTPKHIDVVELMKILDFHPYKPEILIPQPISETEGVYPSSTDTFTLSNLIVMRQRPHTVRQRRQRPEIILGVKGKAAISMDDTSDTITIGQGESVFIPATVDAYTLIGEAELFKASVDLQQGADL